MTPGEQELVFGSLGTLSNSQTLQSAGISSGDTIKLGSTALSPPPSSPPPRSPLLPGRELKAVVTMGFTIAGNIDRVDQLKLQQSIATYINEPTGSDPFRSRDVALTLASGSVVVTAETVMPAIDLATTTVRRFNDESSASLTSALGVTVEAVSGASMAIVAFEALSPPPTSLASSPPPVSLASSPPSLATSPPQISPSASPSASPSTSPSASPSPPFQSGSITEFPPAPPVAGAEGSRQEGGSTDTNPTGAIVGGTIGGIFGGLLLIALVVCLVRRRRRGKEDQMLVRETDVIGSEAVARSHSKRLDAYASSLDRATDTRLNPDHHPPAASIDRATDQRLDPDHHPGTLAPESMELGRDESALTRL